MRRTDIIRPKVDWSLLGAGKAGEYSRRGLAPVVLDGTLRSFADPTCIYYLGYACSVGKEFDQTVAHEVCHHYAHELQPTAAWHGDFFLFMLGGVCKMKPDIYHHWSKARASKVAELLRLQQKMEKVTKIDVTKEAAQRYGLPSL